MLLVGMGSDDFRDFRFHLPKVTGKRPSHLGGAGIDGDPIVEHGREQFPKQQRHGVGQKPIQKQDRQLAVQKIEPLMVRSGENARSLCRGLDPCPQDKRQPNEESQSVARPKCS